MHVFGNTFITSLLTAICLIIPINECLESDVTHETSLPLLDNSLDYYSLDNCRHKSHENRELLIISTLDGKLTAVDVSAGHVVWSKRLSPDPLLSSTISDFEITRRGRVVRVVPSLDGNLYLYNGKTIDGIPLNADTLLKSSYKLGDDLVITGGQESHISGIDIATGRVFYECGLKGCPTTQLNENETFDNLILIKRITQTIRAVDPRSGRQKWFFSVTEPHLSETSSRCHDSTDSSGNPITDESEDILNDTDFKVIVPNGFISAKIHSKHNDQTNGWSHRFDSPLVHVWHYRSGRLNPLNLFDKQKLFGFTNTDLNANGFVPSVYVGLYQNQWYIQSSDKIKGQISETKVTNDLLALKSTDKMETKSELLQIEWKPTALVFDHNNPLDSESDLDFVSSPHFSFAISSENDSKMGYYLFDAIEENETKCLINSSEELLNESEYCDEDNDLMPQIIIRSLWYYWREVTAISIVSAFLLNFCYSLLKRKLKTIRKISESEEICTKSEHISESTAKTPSPSTPSFSTPFNSHNSAEHQAFNSRYESDFEPIQVLGRGGFGLVFEAKHIIDESHYAVKRIYLPVRKEQREKVMREVRALSKLDHSGIVRYYNAWVELPPPGWLEDKDQPLYTTEDIASTHFNESDVRYKQLVVNKTTATDLKTSFYYRESHEMSTETSFGFNKSKQIITKTQSNQSLDIVFDENVSSVKVIDKNSNESIGMSSDNNVFDSKSSESSDESKLNAKSNDLIENNRRPLSLNPVLPRCYLYIQMQLCRKDTLKDWLLNNSLNRDSNTVLDIFDQIVSAVHYVHSMGLMHRDLKPSNIFFSMDGNIKIGDFGLVTATAVDEETHTPGAQPSSDDTNCFILNRNSSSHTNRVGTQLYMSPEQIQNHPYSHKVDIFSMGIILFELLVPFKTEMERNIILNNARKLIFPKDFCEKHSSECDLLNKLLSRNPENRPSTVEIKDHEMLKHFQSVYSFGRQRSRTISLNNGDHL